jgi:type III protein arginine methyltransferase
MSDWSNELSAALASGQPEYMKAMLERVPRDVLQHALPYIYHFAQTNEKEGKLEQAVVYYDQLIAIMPEEAKWHVERERLLRELASLAESSPESLAEPLAEPSDQPLDEAGMPPLQIEMPPPPTVVFDPALFADPALPAECDAFRVDGVRQHLLRYSAQVAPRNTINRLEDPVWLAAWDGALASLSGLKLVLRGSELGLFALRALEHGATQALCMEAHALDARITGGISQKHYLQKWHAHHGAALEGWSEAERRASFEQFASAIDIAHVPASTLATAPAPELPPGLADFDCFIFPQIDHTLLGTGIVKAVRQYCAAGRAEPLRVLPAKATLFAMAVQWELPGTAFNLAPLNHLRWSMYPQALELGPEFWRALTAPTRLGTIDFANFTETEWELALDVTQAGSINAIIYWFELDLGPTQISNAPGSALQCIKPAAQYTDPITLAAGGVLHLRLQLEQTRLHFHTVPPAALPRGTGLPGWYLPLLGDRVCFDAWRPGIERAVAALPKPVDDAAPLVLDIGAGSGLFSMMVAQAMAAQGVGVQGMEQVFGCETQPALVKAGREIIALNGQADKVRLLDKECRKLTVPDDLPRRAALALCTSFDCSLIGDGILHYLTYAREHLLTADAAYLPASARIRAMVIEYRLERIWEIDVNLLNPYAAAHGFINVDASKLAYRALTAPFDVFAFDFATASTAAQESVPDLKASAPGTASAVLFWFDLSLDEHDPISNDPASGSALHWKQGLQFLPEVQVSAGDDLPLVARHNGSALKFQWQPERLQKESLSRIPRLDPRWLAENGELEQQTQGLLEHCMQNPQEFTKVADIAQRMAIDPAAYGLNPAIAQRFASMLISD